MAIVRDFNLFPTTDRLLNLERKYGDSLSHEDLYGVPAKPKRRRINDETMSVAFTVGGEDTFIQQKSVTAYSMAASH